jgi:NhaA family Na+:H+ antiporter
MTLFFFVVGLEIKREITTGELRERRSALLPVIGALGGMLFPALIYLSFTSGSAAARGWAIPIATDIAFAVAVLSVAGKRLPGGLKVFLLSLAIADDIGATVVIGLFYAHDVQILWLVALAAALGASFAFARSSLSVVLIAGAVAWWCAWSAGIHPAVTGALVALTVPVAKGRESALEDRLHPWSSFVVLPVFALVNAGIVIELTEAPAMLGSSASLGIVIGLIVGKTVGISTFAWAAVKLGAARLPEGVDWRSLVGAAAAAGIGFTVSLFITDLAFPLSAEAQTAKLAVFVASLGSAALAAALLRGPRLRISAQGAT